jgi:hypothetical protein
MGPRLIRYREIAWPPGVHRALLKRCRAKGSTLPIVLDGKTVVEGSGAIIGWAESKARDRTRSLNPETDDLAEVREIERRADQVIGVHVRRLAYVPRLCLITRISLNRRSSSEAPLGTA